jgi:DNA (cytosine-5)-methyltransferase 1
MARPTGIDLFAGAGGMSLGFEQAGFDVVAAVEIDPIHAAIHSFNFPKTAVIPRSVIGLTGSEIRKAAGIGARTVNVVFGGAPCQGFSMIGQRQLHDPRNQLVGEFVRIVAELNADYAVFENVKGLTVGRHKQFLEEIVREFNSNGYEVRLPWKVLNAASYGVPQHRQRLFLLAARKGLKLPEYPQETSCLVNEAGALNLLPSVPTCSEALDDLPDAEKHSVLEHRDWVRVARWRKPSTYAAELRCQTNDCWRLGYVREWDPTLLTSSLRTEHTDISRRRFSETLGGEVEPISRFFRLPADGLSNTLRAGTDSARGAFTSPRPIHHRLNRCVTVREMMRLHGYPDWFRMHVTKWHGARQAGNSVPPPLARAVAGEVILAGNYPRIQPKGSLKLGSEELLSFGMVESMAHFNLNAAPIGRRDRKSGSKKRRQIDIDAEHQAAE